MATTKADDAQAKLSDIGLVVLGAAILIIHILLFKFSPAVFSIFISLYIVAYVIVVLWYVYKYTNYVSKGDFDLITYVSFYTLFLQVGLILLAIGVMIYRYVKDNKGPAPKFKF